MIDFEFFTLDHVRDRTFTSRWHWLSTRGCKASNEGFDTFDACVRDAEVNGFDRNALPPDTFLVDLITTGHKAAKIRHQ
jgi:hypothetical protein